MIFIDKTAPRKRGENDRNRKHPKKNNIINSFFFKQWPLIYFFVSIFFYSFFNTAVDIFAGITAFFVINTFFPFV